MTDSISQQQVNAIRDAIDARIENAFGARFERWILGRRYEDGIRLTDSLISGGNRVYVRPTNDSYEYRVVWGNASGGNLPVWIFQMPDGEWYLFSPYYAQAGAIGTKADTVFMPPIAGDVARFVLSGENFRPGRVRIDSAGGLNAYVEPFLYWYEGVYKRWEGGAVDLTSAAPGTAEQWRWVKIGINPATNAITTANGTTQNFYEALTETQLAAIGTNTPIWVAGVKLRNGQTRVGITETDIVDARPHYWTPHPALDKTTQGSRFDPSVPPSSPDALNDEFSNSSVSGSWTEFDIGARFTMTEDAAGLLMTTTTAAAEIGGLYKSIPAGDFTIQAYVGTNGNHTASTDNETGAGIALWQGTGATDDLFVLWLDGKNQQITARTHTAYNNLGTNVGAQISGVQTGVHLRMTRTGTTYACFASWDGITWRTVYNATIGFTPTHFGVVGQTSLNFVNYQRFQYFRYTNSALNASQLLGGARVSLITA